MKTYLLIWLFNCSCAVGAQWVTTTPGRTLTVDTGTVDGSSRTVFIIPRVTIDGTAQRLWDYEIQLTGTTRYLTTTEPEIIVEGTTIGSAAQNTWRKRNDWQGTDFYNNAGSDGLVSPGTIAFESYSPPVPNQFSADCTLTNNTDAPRRYFVQIVSKPGVTPAFERSLEIELKAGQTMPLHLQEAGDFEYAVYYMDGATADGAAVQVPVCQGDAEDEIVETPVGDVQSGTPESEDYVPPPPDANTEQDPVTDLATLNDAQNARSTDARNDAGRIVDTLGAIKQGQREQSNAAHADSLAEQSKLGELVAGDGVTPGEPEAGEYSNSEAVLAELDDVTEDLASLVGMASMVIGSDRQFHVEWTFPASRLGPARTIVWDGADYETPAAFFRAVLLAGLAFWFVRESIGIAKGAFAG